MAVRVTVETHPFIEFSRPTIGPEEIEAVADAMRSGWLSCGPRTKEFETAFAAFVGARYGVAVNSCTAALHLSLLAEGVGPGDEVITTPLTFCATANAVLHTGATPVFADIDLLTMNIDPAAVEAAITPKTRVLLPVHFGGRPADVLTLRALARRRDLALIEDAAHCVDGMIGGERIGAIGDFTCFSFYATKNLTTGEGGMITTDSREQAEWLRIAALQGMSRDAWARYSRAGGRLYDVVMAGFKYNMTDLQAAVGLQQLRRLADMQARREAIWARYDEAFADLPVTRPAEPAPGTRHARHLYTLLVDPDVAGCSRDGLREALRERGIGTSVHFTALHLFAYYADRLGLKRGMFPNAEFVCDRTMSLPFSSAMTDEEVERVIESVRALLACPRGAS
ncbi:MAG TPA: DegT/DnrJ/EryC1/StrS family aminotransferase [Vicinamibacterales bacterium]|jgi:dTDP-4-amino-4,6-dideoxygalactose transaminase